MLRTHLDAFPAPDLRAIAIRLGVNRRTFTRNEQRAAAIAAFWLEAPDRHHLLTTLSAEAVAALTCLVRYPALPRALFLRQFGRLQRTPPSAATPAQAASPTDELFFAGLLHAPQPIAPRRAQAFALPDDLRPIVAQFLTPPHAGAVQPEPADRRQPAAAALVHDVAYLTLFLHRAAVLEDAPAGRTLTRLTPTRLRTLNSHLVSPDVPERAVSRTRRLRWLLLWAHAAGLLDGANRPTPALLPWLDLPLPTQTRALWDAWRAAPLALRHRYHSPDADLPEPWPALFWAAFAALPDAFAPEDLTAALLADRQWDRFWATHFETLADLEATVTAALAQGVAEFGLVTGGAAGYMRTPFAGWLLNLKAPIPVTSTTLPITWQETADAATLTVAAGVCSSALLWLAPCADVATAHTAAAASSDPGIAPPHHHYRFTAESVAQAVRAGITVTTLFAGLEQLGVTLPASTAQRLAAWGEPAPAVTVAVHTLLRAPDRTTLSAIAQHPKLRTVVAEILAPTVALAHGTPDEVRKLLHDAGFAPAELTVTADTRPAAPESRSSHAGALWLAGQTYALLGKHLPLPVTPPYAEMERLLAALPAAQQAALEALRSQLAEAAMNVLDGQVYAPTYEPTDPDQWRPLLDAAAGTGALLDMVYVSPARNLPTLHRIEPYWLEEQRGIPYVRAYCHLADAVRLFRLDRIQSLRYTILIDS